jgi:hypothetical protein
MKDGDFEKFAQSGKAVGGVGIGIVANNAKRDFTNSLQRKRIPFEIES